MSLNRADTFANKRVWMKSSNLNSCLTLILVIKLLSSNWTNSHPHTSMRSNTNTLIIPFPLHYTFRFVCGASFSSSQIPRGQFESSMGVTGHGARVRHPCVRLCKLQFLSSGLEMAVDVDRHRLLSSSAIYLEEVINGAFRSRDWFPSRNELTG
jgi:hypothetical protein